MVSVFDVSNFFIDFFINSDEDSVTNLQLNKLLYFAQGHYLARTGLKLFGDEIEAWKWGPVVPRIYSCYKKCGKSPITELVNTYSSFVFDGEEEQLLIDVLREYGKYSPSALVTITHQSGTPWDNVYIPGKNAIITSEKMKLYFQKEENKLVRFDEIIGEIETAAAAKLPKEWYDESEDSVWEAYM